MPVETALKTVHDTVSEMDKELIWMSSENRAQQRHQCGLPLLTSVWPPGLNPEGRQYMLGAQGTLNPNPCRSPLTQPLKEPFEESLIPGLLDS